MKVILLAPASPDREQIAEWLGTRGYQVMAAATAAGAAAAIDAGASFAFLDFSARQEALAFLRGLVTAARAVWCVAIVDPNEPGLTGDALRLGAVDVVMRPVREGDVLASLANAREVAGLAARRASQPASPKGELATQSPRMREVYDMARRAAPSRCPILIVGERGTGRESLARAIHAHGTLHERPFVRLPGAAPVADLRRALEDAVPSTVYVEEVGELCEEGQLLLERWLAESRETPAAPHRVIAAAQPRIVSMIERRAFRASLFDALATVRFDLPTLRERPQDIPLLAVHFLKESCARHGVQAKTFSRSALALLSALPWRGNAAELRTLVERLALMVPRGVVLQEDVLQHLRFDGARVPEGAARTLREARQQFEREFIAAALHRHGWRMEEAAAELGMERTNLYRKIKQLSIIRGNGRT